jgi:hypothetical protein
MEDALTTTESNQLESLEAVIKSGMQTFVDVGNALLAIRDGRLYRASHGTFKAYCRERWGFARSYASYMIESAKVVENIRVHNCGQTPVPATESQARPLAQLEPEEQPVAWKEATDKAESEGRRVTARDVEKAVEERKERKARNTTPARSRGSFTDWQKLRELFEIVQDAINQMGDLKVDAQHRIQARSMCEAMSGRFNKLAQKLVE